MSRSVLFLNGRYRSSGKARVSALDRGLLFGDGLFETIRVVDGKAVALTEHLERMRRSGRRIGLNVPGNDATWRGRIASLARRNGLARGETAARLTITRGAAGHSLLPPARPRLTQLLTLRRIDPAIAALRRRGVRVTLLPFHPGLAGYLAGVKTTDYLTAMIGKRNAERRGSFEGLYTAPGGEVFEGTTSNLFVVRGRALLTPPLSRGVLPGVTRAGVLGLAARERLPVRERRLRQADLFTASEIFLTASTIGIVPVRAVDGHALPAPVPGPVTRILQDMLEAASSKPHPRSP